MTTILRSSLARAGLMLCAVALAACGGGGDAAPAPAPAAPAPAPAAPAPAPGAPAPGPAPAPPGATVAACYDLAPAQGKTVRLERRWTSVDLAGKVTSGQELEESVVLGPATFEGHSATATRTTYTPAGSAPYISTTYAAQTGPAELTEYGDVSESVSAGAPATSKTVWTPPLVSVLTAVPGDTMTLSGTMVVTSTVNGVAQPPLTAPVSTTGVFVGFEPVTVPAGTFSACRFEQKHAGPQGPTTTHWWLLGHGIELKSQTPASALDGGGSHELTSLLVNGAVPQ